MDLVCSGGELFLELTRSIKSLNAIAAKKKSLIKLTSFNTQKNLLLPNALRMTWTGSLRIVYSVSDTFLNKLI